MSHDDSSWEDIYDSGQLERQLQNFDSDQLEPVSHNQIATEPSSLLDVGKVEAQIRILKRSESSQGGAVERCHPENRHLIEQSVAQRERDYAVARERIMGPKHNNKSMEKKKDRPKRVVPQKPGD